VETLEVGWGNVDRVEMEQDKLVIHDLNGPMTQEPFEVSPLMLLYIIQEYQKHFTLTAFIDWSLARGIMGTPE